jgi:hypothetical protein
MRKVSRAGLSTAGNVLKEDLPVCIRFKARRPRALSVEKSWSNVQIDGCEWASRPAESGSKLASEEQKKRKRVMPIASRFTTASLYQGRAQ